MANPVWKVRVGDQEAILRAVVDPDALAAYKGFSGSSVTPDLLAHGTVNGESWAVLEWTPGQVLYDPSSNPMRVDVRLAGHLDDAVDLSEKILATAATLPHITSPETALEETRTRIKRRTRALSGGPAEAAAIRLEEQLQAHWGDAVLQHGDLNPMNVIFVARGHYRFIDLLGGHGPLERDAGWWSGMVLFIIDGKDDLDPVKKAEVYCHQIAKRVPNLDEGRLRYWTASSLIDRAALGAVGLGSPRDEGLLHIANALV